MMYLLYLVLTTAVHRRHCALQAQAPASMICRLQRQYFQEQEAAGRLQVRPPTPPKPTKSLQEKHGMPAHLPALLADAETAMSLNFSRQLWGNAVPGTCTWGSFTATE